MRSSETTAAHSLSERSESRRSPTSQTCGCNTMNVKTKHNTMLQ